MDDPDLAAVFTRPQALAAGLTRHQLAFRLRAGQWHRLRPGWYCLSQTWWGADARTRHRLQTVAAVSARRDGSLASHLSAACLLGWLSPLNGYGAVTLTSPHPGQPVRRRAGSVVQVAEVPAGDRSQRHGVGVTSPARTAADLLRHESAAEAVALVDGALRRGDMNYEQVAQVLRSQSCWPLARRGLASLELVDPRRETWLESWSFVQLYSQGVPLPEPQVDIFDSRGRWIARVDGLWLQDATVAEADGQVKYALAGPIIAGTDSTTPTAELVDRAQRRLTDQRRREDRLRDTGLQVVRYGVADVLRDLPGLAQQVNQRRASGAASAFTGRFRLQPALPWVARAQAS